MLCQFCGKNKATNKFNISMMGMNKELFICDECLDRFRDSSRIPGDQGAMMPNDDQGIGRAVSWPMVFGFPNVKERKLGSDPFNVDAGKEIRVKRELNQLYKQLSNAIKDERYEDAAVLRDKINKIKKEVFINGK